MKNDDLSGALHGKRTRRNVKIGLLLIFSLLYVLAIANCSHTKPYYRSEADVSAKISVDENAVKQRILLIGDAGAAENREPSLLLLRKWAEKIPSKTVVLFLGDNIYPDGLPPEEDPWREEAERRLNVQIEAVEHTGARGIFIPGNHDWAKGRSEGLAHLNNQEAFINAKLPGETSFLPPGGCPGPVKVDLDGVRLIILDTHWWFHLTNKPTNLCPQQDKDGIVQELKALIDSAGEREVIIAAHHPLATHGPHGGFFSWKDHIFPLTNLKNWLWIPLPVIGSIYPLGRWYVVKSDQDIVGPNYREMIERINEVLAGGRPLIYAAGHDHNLQVLEMESGVKYMLVSGAGLESKINEVGHGDNTAFAHAHTGFMSVDFLQDNRVLLRVLEPGENEVVFQKWIK